MSLTGGNNNFVCIFGLRQQVKYGDASDLLTWTISQTLPLANHCSSERHLRILMCKHTNVKHKCKMWNVKCESERKTPVAEASVFVCCWCTISLFLLSFSWSSPSCLIRCVRWWNVWLAHPQFVKRQSRVSLYHAMKRQLEDLEPKNLTKRQDEDGDFYFFLTNFTHSLPFATVKVTNDLKRQRKVNFSAWKCNRYLLCSVLCAHVIVYCLVVLSLSFSLYQMQWNAFRSGLYTCGPFSLFLTL